MYYRKATFQYKPTVGKFASFIISHSCCCFLLYSFIPSKGPILTHILRQVNKEIVKIQRVNAPAGQMQLKSLIEAYVVSKAILVQTNTSKFACITAI